MVVQFRSFSQVRTLVLRDSGRNIFNEIQILKQVTDDLKKEIEVAEKRKEDISSEISGLAAIEEEKARLQLLSGDIAIKGQGIVITIKEIIPAFWLIDLVNELATAGSEAIAVNGIRVTPQNAGFQVLPPETLIFGRQVFYPPITIEAIGEKNNLTSALLQVGGFIERLERGRKFTDVVLEKRETIEIKAL